MIGTYFWSQEWPVGTSKRLVRQEGGMEMRVPGTSKVATPAWDPLELR